jgi:hypothetical protein
MSTDYSFLGLLGISVPIDKLLTTVRKRVRNCDHALLNDYMPYCPECGRRTYRDTSETTYCNLLTPAVENYTYSMEPQFINKWVVFISPEVHKGRAWIGIRKTDVCFAQTAILDLDVMDTAFKALVEDFIADMKKTGMWEEGFRVQYWLIPHIS